MTNYTLKIIMMEAANFNIEVTPKIDSRQARNSFQGRILCNKTRDFKIPRKFKL